MTFLIWAAQNHLGLDLMPMTIAWRVGAGDHLALSAGFAIAANSR
ncbi:MAG: hypothetical protein AAFR29_06595 [Pseudomonadota bacterium]